MGKTKDSLRELASQIAKLEGKKTQARIGEVREILKLLCIVSAKHWFDTKDTPSYLVGRSPLSLIHERAAFLFDKLKEKDEKAKKKLKKTSR